MGSSLISGEFSVTVYAETEQLSHSADWFDAEYNEPRYVGVPILIHPSRVPMWDAVPRQGARIMSFERFAEFRTAFGGFVAALRISDGYQNPTTVGTNLTQFGLNAGSLQQRWTQTFNPPAAR
jgi:hypothetical protein